MRLGSTLPALVVALATQGPAQDASNLPPGIQTGQSILTAPAAANTPAPHGVTTVNTTSGQVQSSTSSTKQFTVYGADLQTRGAFCLLCEDIANDLGRLLKDDGRFALPVVVVVKTPPNINPAEPVITTSFSQLAYGGFHLQINAELRQDFNAEDFSRELVRMLLAERILRNHKEVQTTRSQLLSGWLLTGVTQAMEFRARSRPSALFAAVFRSGQVYSIDRIIEANPKELDALARGIYEVSSCALVLALLEQQDGSLRFSRFLSALANGKKGDRELLKEHFPTLGVSKNSLEKWWTLQMASLATPSTFESMSFAQTEEAMANALAFRIPTSGSNDGNATPRAAAGRAGATEAATAEGAEKEPEKKRSWFRFGRKDKKEEEEGAAKEEPKPATTPAPAPAPAANPTPGTVPTPAPATEPAPEKKGGFFRNFGGGRKIAAPVKPAPEGVDGAPAKPAPAATTPAPKPNPAARTAANTAKPAPAATTAAPATEEKKKGGGLFGLFGKKKEATPAPAPTPAPTTPTTVESKKPVTRKPAPKKPEEKPETAKAEEAKGKESEKTPEAPKSEEKKPEGEAKAPDAEKMAEVKPGEAAPTDKATEGEKPKEGAEEAKLKEGAPAPATSAATADTKKAESAPAGAPPATPAPAPAKEGESKESKTAAGDTKDKEKPKDDKPAVEGQSLTPAAPGELPKSAEGTVEITMPSDAEVRRPGEALPPGISATPTPGSEFMNPTLPPGLPALPGVPPGTPGMPALPGVPPGTPGMPAIPGAPNAEAGPQGLPFLPTPGAEPTLPPPSMGGAGDSPLPPVGTPLDPDLTRLEDYTKLAKRKDRTEILKRTLNQINSVKMRAHPLYRDLIGGYATAVQNLILGREKGVPEELASLRKKHEEIRAKARAVESYVDWYEASQTQTYSHVFDDYLKLRDDLDKDVIPRTDALARYLDALEKEFEE